MPAQTKKAKVLRRGINATAPPLEFTVYNEHGAPMDLAGITVTIDVAHASGNHYYSPYGRILSDAPCEVWDAAQGVVRYNLQPGDLALAGTFHCRLTLHYGDGTHEPAPIDAPTPLIVRERVGGP